MVAADCADSLQQLGLIHRRCEDAVQFTLVAFLFPVPWTVGQGQEREYQWQAPQDFFNPITGTFKLTLFARTPDDAYGGEHTRGTGKAIILACLSLMLGFGVMLLSSFPPVRRFGELIGVTVFGTMLATLIVLPALLRVGAPGSRPSDA